MRQTSEGRIHGTRGLCSTLLPSGRLGYGSFLSIWGVFPSLGKYHRDTTSRYRRVTYRASTVPWRRLLPAFAFPSYLAVLVFCLPWARLAGDVHHLAFTIIPYTPAARDVA